MRYGSFTRPTDESWCEVYVPDAFDIFFSADRIPQAERAVNRALWCPRVAGALLFTDDGADRPTHRERDTEITRRRRRRAT